jgi:hypothetical protein
MHSMGDLLPLARPAKGVGVDELASMHSMGDLLADCGRSVRRRLFVISDPPFVLDAGLLMLAARPWLSGDEYPKAVVAWTEVSFADYA